ncbi:hypothetical protein [Psychroserpens burtonensis]|nr:hypothetical protein [Psychroserpens burtonensis]
MENKTGKYFKYAIGEIILVVIGILIALYLNNLNEIHNSQAKIDILLEEVLNELNVNIATIENEIDFFHKKDSVFWAVKQNRVTKETYADPMHPEFINMTTLFTQFQLTNDAYQLLIANRENTPIIYKPIIKKLNTLDSKLKASLDDFDKELLDAVKTNIKFYSDNYSWFSDDTAVGDENYYNYMLEDYGYKNKVYFFNSLAIRNHLGVALAYRSNAINYYTEIATLLNKADVNPSFTYTNDQLQPFIGSYEAIANTVNDSLIKSTTLPNKFKIYKENENLFLKIEGDSVAVEVIPFSKNQMVTRGRNFFTYFAREKDTIIESNSKIIFKKL